MALVFHHLCPVIFESEVPPRVDILAGSLFLSPSPLLRWTFASATSLSLPSLFLLPHPFSAHISAAPHFPLGQSQYNP